MAMKWKIAAALLFLLAPIQTASSITNGPFDTAGLTRDQIVDHFKKLVGRTFETSGVVKDVEEMNRMSDVVYQMPVYWYDGAKYVRYGFVYQRKGDATVFLADDGYLSPFVRKNAVDRPVLASGRIIDGTKTGGLPKGVVILISSLRLENEVKNDEVK